MFKTIKWKFADYETKKEVYLFNNFLTIGTHYKGCNSFCLEFSFDGGSCGIGTNGIWQIGNKFESKIKVFGKLRFIRLRLGKPIITLHTNKKSMNKSVEATLRYKIN